MATNRTAMIGIGAIVVVAAAAAAYVFLGGGGGNIPLISTRSTLHIEAAGVNYGGWPIMGVKINGEDVGTMTIDSQARKVFDFGVPHEAGDINTVELTITNRSYCQNFGGTGTLSGTCDARKIILRSVTLEDRKLEGGVASGELNSPNLLVNDEGGVKFEVDS